MLWFCISVHSGNFIMVPTGSIISYPIFVCASFLTDNTPVEQPKIDEGGLEDPENLELRISWNPLQEEDGREYLQNYIVHIDISDLSSTNRRKRQTSPVFDTLPPDVSTYTYGEARPYFRYVVQVLADLEVNGMMTRRPVTGINTIQTPESCESKGVMWAFTWGCMLFYGACVVDGNEHLLYTLYENALTHLFVFKKEF